MKKILMMLLTIMLVLPMMSFAEKQQTFLENIQKRLEKRIELTQSRQFNPQLELLSDNGGWAAKVNDDYLLGVVTIFEAADEIPYKQKAPEIWETKEFGFIIGVVTTILISFSLR